MVTFHSKTLLNMKTLAVFAGMIMLALASFSQASHAQTKAEIEINVHEETALTEKGRTQLKRILANYNLDPWIYTHKVMIQSRVIPHSHPVLTLNTLYVNDDISQLTTFIHEQIHWYLSADTIATELAIGEFKARYPEVPVRGGQGARSEYSTYLHLIVCWLELDAMTHLIGKEAARKLISEMTHYQWIYKQVLEEGDYIQSVVEKHGLKIEKKG